MKNHKHMKKVFLAYIIPRTFSGQSAATDLIISSCSGQGWTFIKLPLFSVSRAVSNILVRYYSFITKSFKIFPGLFNLLFTKNPIVYINIGQGIPSFIRVLWWYFPILQLKSNLRVVISLHGHSFMSWTHLNRQTRIFLYILNTARIITVLGPNQKNKLIELGIPESKVRIVPNTCDLRILREDEIIKKHKNEDGINILYLSLLVESKGFPEFMEAIELLAKSNPVNKIKAILCGPIAITSVCTRFKSAIEIQKWIQRKVEVINAINPEKLSVEWIAGARGKEKETLFRNAHIFALPTCFPNEAQPLVLIEALASGCAIITTKAGEIASTLNQNSAIYLDQVNPESLLTEMKYLIASPELRTNYALSGLRLIQGPLSISQYANTWESIFNSI